VLAPIPVYGARFLARFWRVLFLKGVGWGAGEGFYNCWLLCALLLLCFATRRRERTKTNHTQPSSSSLQKPSSLQNKTKLPKVAWAVAYYLKIFVISAERIRARGYATLFEYVSNTEKKGVYAAIARRTPPQLRPPVVRFSVPKEGWHTFCFVRVFVCFFAPIPTA
jgi:hypothetical protein